MLFIGKVGILLALVALPAGLTPTPNRSVDSYGRSSRFGAPKTGWQKARILQRPQVTRTPLTKTQTVSGAVVCFTIPR